jgi:tetratricopeptide (TPR) repeat protein
MEPSTNKTTYDYDSHNQLHVNNHNDPCVISQAEEHTGAKDTVNVKYMNPKIGITHHSTTSFRPGQNNDSELCQSPLPENNLDSSSSPINVPKTRKVTEVLPETLQNTSDSQDMEKNYKGDEDDPLHLLHKVKRRAIKRLNRFASSTQNETDNQNWETSSFNRFTLDDESNESFDTEEDNDDDDPDNHDSHFKEDVNLAQRLKTEGNDLFKDQAYQAAAIKYTEALKFSAGLEFSGILLCNRAACYLLLKNYRQVIKDCNDGLLLFPSYVKVP